jgi:hypothetical protein
MTVMMCVIDDLVKEQGMDSVYVIVTKNMINAFLFATFFVIYDWFSSHIFILCRSWLYLWFCSTFNKFVKRLIKTVLGFAPLFQKWIKWYKHTATIISNASNPSTNQRKAGIFPIHP